MEFYHRGNWVVSTPILVGDEGDIEERMFFMVCPHLEYAEVETSEFKDEDSGVEYLAIKEMCIACSAIRMRLFPKHLPLEPFDPSIPTTGPWFERLYNFGNFTVLVRRQQSQPGAPPNFLTRVETAGGNVHAGFVMLPILAFAPAALELFEDLELLFEYGPDRYVKYRALKEKRGSAQEKEDLREHVESLYPVAMEIGPEAVASAKAVMEGEVERELAEHEEYSAQALEREAAHIRQAAAAKAKRKK